MQSKVTVAAGLVIFTSLCLDSSIATRVQPKHAWKVVPQEGFEAEVAQNPIISVVHDTADLQHNDAPSASSLISRSQTSEKSDANRLKSKASEENLPHESGEAPATDSQTSAKSGGPLRLFAAVPGIFSRAIPLETSANQFWYGAVAIASLVMLACFSFWMDWVKAVWKGMAKRNTAYDGATTKSERSQYTHKGRVIYEWEQTPATMVLYTKLPKGIKKKDVDVKMWPRHIKLGRVGKLPFIKEELFNNVDVSECKWDVDRNGELSVKLAKILPEDWPCVFKAHAPSRSD